MKKKRYSEEKIVKILLEAEKQEKPITEFCKLGGFSPESRLKRTLFGIHSQVLQKQPVSGH